MYRNWAPVLARLIFGATFLMAAYYKIPGTESFTMEVNMSAAAGIPFPLVAVFLAFLLELFGGLALVFGVWTRVAAFLLAPFVLLIALFFFRNLADQAQFGMFMSCMGLIAGLLYVSVYGARHAAVSKDA
ncbi:DoxX family protein [Candidatus Parcubacteria bacterium]|nr:DoxX family protein [Candidatus Parcubacteria bacterium]